MAAGAVPRRRRNAKAYRAATDAEEARIIARGESPDVQALVGINYGVATRDEQGALVFEYPAHAKPGDAPTCCRSTRRASPSGATRGSAAKAYEGRTTGHSCPRRR